MKLIFSLFFLLSFVSFLQFHSSFNESEFLRQVKKNLFGNDELLQLAPANYDLSKVSSIYERSKILVIPLLPSNEEVLRYQQVTPIISRVNERFALGVIKGIPQANAWANRQEQTWQLDKDHPRANKTNCVRITQLAYQYPLVVYESYKQIDHQQPFYVLYQQNVLIHEMGIVASPNGYFQPLDSCELRYKFIGRKWYNHCVKPMLTSSQPHNWTTLTSPDSILHSRNHTYCQIAIKLIDYSKEKKKKVKRKKATAEKRVKRFQVLHDETATTTTHSTYSTNHLRKLQTNSIITYEPTFFQYTERVLLIAVVWDYNYHHFLIDCLVRLIRILPWIQSDPTLKLHIRAYEHTKPRNTTNYHVIGPALRRKVFQLLGIAEERIVSGYLITKEVYITKHTVCNLPIVSAFEVRLLSERLIQAAWKEINATATNSSSSSSLLLPPFVMQYQGQTYPDKANNHNETNSKKKYFYPKRILLQIRECFFNNATNDNVAMVSSDCLRGWYKEDYTLLLTTLHTYFPLAEILSISNTNASKYDCLSCEIVGYQQIDLLIGIHGAGLTNVMFLSPNSVVVEITGQYDGRMMPYCGYHGGLASLFGVHHVVYYYDWRDGQPLNATDLMQEILTFYQLSTAEAITATTAGQ